MSQVANTGISARYGAEIALKSSINPSVQVFCNLARAQGWGLRRDSSQMEFLHHTAGVDAITAVLADHCRTCDGYLVRPFGFLTGES
jgi:hypothetical protein